MKFADLVAVEPKDVKTKKAGKKRPVDDDEDEDELELEEEQEPKSKKAKKTQPADDSSLLLAALEGVIIKRNAELVKSVQEVLAKAKEEGSTEAVLAAIAELPEVLVEAIKGGGAEEAKEEEEVEGEMSPEASKQQYRQQRELERLAEQQQQQQHVPEYRRRMDFR